MLRVVLRGCGKLQGSIEVVRCGFLLPRNLIEPVCVSVCVCIVGQTVSFCIKFKPQCRMQHYGHRCARPFYFVACCNSFLFPTSQQSLIRTVVFLCNLNIDTELTEDCLLLNVRRQ